MAFETLYLKYRPLDFNTVYGQNHIRRTLQNAVKNNKIAHAYLFTGPRGTGKTTTARIIAKSINCLALTAEGNPCNQCAMCLAINDDHLVDVIELDAASHTGVDDIREIIDKAQFSPTLAQKKVYIIDEVHMLSKPAFNALLKTLEEPPEHVHFILATTEYQKVPETIISRCQRFDFRRINEEDIVENLTQICQTEGIAADPEALALIARYAEGGMRDALGLLDKIQTDHQLTVQMVKDSLEVTSQEIIRQFIETLDNGSPAHALKFVHEIYSGGVNLVNFTKELLEELRQRMLTAALANDLSRALREKERIEVFEGARDQFRTAFIPQLPLEMAVLKLQYGDTPPATPPPPPVNPPTPVAKPAPVPTPVTPEPVVTNEEVSPPPAELPADELADEIRRQWLDIIAPLDSVKRNALKSVVISHLSDHKLSINCRSNIELQKVDNAKTKADLSEYIYQRLNFKPTIIFTFRKIDLNTTPPAIDHPPAEPSGIKIQDVADLFGGEVTS